MPESPPFLGERYTVLRLLGAGGMGQVWLAHDGVNDRDVAIKVLDPELAGVVGPQRFLREIHVAAGLAHPAIVPLYDSGEFGGRLFYVMPYVEGESLRARLDRDTMLSVAQALDWTIEVAEGLAFLHAHGIVHRDVKPGNLLIEGDHLVIADFGLAKAIGAAATDELTSERLVVGTPVYMSPEQASGAKRIDGRSDIYSLGCVLYEMLAGEPPYGGATTQNITAKKLAGQYAPLRIVRPTVPAAVDRALQRALAPVAADRFESAEEFCRSLRAAKAGKLRPRLRLAALVTIAAAIVVAIGQRSRVASPVAGRQRIVIGMFANRTGDPRYDPVGFMAADWITEGLQRTNAVDVVPTLTALAATRFLQGSADSLDPIRALARETGARLVVTGSVYQDRDSLILQAQLVDAAAGRLIAAVEPLRASAQRPIEALQELRARTMGILALSLDDRALRGDRPPTYDAYLAFSEAIDAYDRGDYEVALTGFESAHAADSTYIVPLLYAAFCYSNLQAYASADSVLHIAVGRARQLSPYDRYWLEYQVAELAGKDDEALAAIRHAAELAPTSKATYNFAVRAVEARQPFPAESALRTLPPDVGAMRGWLPYWQILAIALHAQGKYLEELTAGREARRRFPDRVEARAAEARALAAMRDRARLERVWSETSSMATATPSERGSLALEVGSELWAHGDSATARIWLQRAYDSFAPGTGPQMADLRWERAQAAARLGRLADASALAQALTSQDSTRSDYLGFAGILAAKLGDPRRADDILKRLAADTRPYTYGNPQFQAARIAVEIGDLPRATDLLAAGEARGLPFSLDLHRDPVLTPLRNTAIYRHLNAQPH